MKSVEIAPAILADPGLSGLVRRATEVLERVVGPSSSGQVSATWSLLRDDKDRPLLGLEIADWTGAAPPMVFAPDELRSDWHTEGRMLRLWGDLLQVRSHEQIKPILQSLQEHGVS